MILEYSVENYIDQHNIALCNLNVEEIDNAIKIIKNTIQKGKRVAVCGNGGSAAAASHFITDWNKMV